MYGRIGVWAYVHVRAHVCVYLIYIDEIKRETCTIHFYLVNPTSVNKNQNQHTIMCWASVRFSAFRLLPGHKDTPCMWCVKSVSQAVVGSESCSLVWSRRADNGRSVFLKCLWCQWLCQQLRLADPKWRRAERPTGARQGSNLAVFILLLGQNFPSRAKYQSGEFWRERRCITALPDLSHLPDLLGLFHLPDLSDLPSLPVSSDLANQPGLSDQPDLSSPEGIFCLVKESPILRELRGHVRGSKAQSQSSGVFLWVSCSLKSSLPRQVEMLDSKDQQRGKASVRFLTTQKKQSRQEVRFLAHKHNIISQRFHKKLIVSFL